MFGILRTALALLVVAGHLGPVERIGPYAVFGFYALSGYLMTAILRERYGYSAAGIGRYAANRVLRIFPIYWVALALSVVLLWWVGESAARAYHESMGLRLPATEVWRNLLLVLSIDTGTRWVPPAWALSVEIFYYAAIGLGLSRHAPVCALWLGASIAYTAYLNLDGASFSYRYFTVPAASLPFAMGAMLHHLQGWRAYPRRLVESRALLLLLALAFIANGVAASVLGGASAQGWQFYLSLMLAWGLIACLATRRSARLRELDSRIGDLSYPIYLLHYQAGLVLVLLGLPWSRGHPAFALLGAALTVLLSMGAVRLLDPAIQGVRNRIRPVAAARA